MTDKLELIQRFFRDPKDCFFLFGPRGTGKSTWAQIAFDHALRIDLLAPDIFRTLSAKPERLRELIHGNPVKKTVIIDEIQKIPHLLTVVHSLIEDKAGIQFILTGSSSRKLKRSGFDLLGGRALYRTLHPFMAGELGQKFDLEKALEIGLLPVVMNSRKPSDTLQAYITLYLREEVQAEGLVRNLGNFSRFLEAASFSHASLINVSNLARDCEIQRKVVEGYVSILEDLLLAFKIPVFDKRAKRDVTHHPKFYLFDSGVYHILRPKGPLDLPERIGEAALEGLIAQHLRAWIAYGDKDYKLSFWRTRSGLEVDFVIYGTHGFWAIEVKNTGRIRPEDLRSLRAFQEDYAESKTLFLYRGRDRVKTKGILCLPCEDFLKELHPAHPIGFNL